jgi:PAS domain S-box-containing protein
MSFKILLIEDEDPHAELIQRAFEDQIHIFTIHRAKSLAEARTYMRLNEVDLIIADWRLPDGESMELLPSHNDPLYTPIILMTSYGNERIAVEALKSGALDYVVKSPESMLDMPHIAEKAIEQSHARVERAYMQKALLQSEAQFRLLAENASDMIIRLATDGTMLYISPASKTILGYSPEELTSKSSFDLIHPEDLPWVARLFGERQHKSLYTITYRALQKEGEYVWLETSARTITDKNTNQIIEIQTASRDITERKKAEEALKIAHQHLQEAYEKTIEGWVHALDLRDKETEGHTQRVTELTLLLAAKLGFNEQEMIHLKRGALLHDMGKIGIPDEILQKPGPLTKKEWAIMHQHPIYAKEMLSNIDYLRPALTIPYCHHERWDGSGYPHGLKGEEIPLEARLFAIVDVWDALSSDRPYRGKLTKEETITYLQKNSGILFDAQLLDAFLEMITSQK